MAEAKPKQERRRGVPVTALWIVTLLVLVLLFCVCVALVFSTHLIIKPIIATP